MNEVSESVGMETQMKMMGDGKKDGRVEDVGFRLGGFSPPEPDTTLRLPRNQRRQYFELTDCKVDFFERYLWVIKRQREFI